MQLYYKKVDLNKDIIFPSIIKSFHIIKIMTTYLAYFSMKLWYVPTMRYIVINGPPYANITTIFLARPV